MTRVMSMVKNSKVKRVWMSSFPKCPNKHHAAGGKWFFIFFPWDSGADVKSSHLGGWWVSEDLEVRLLGLGEKIPCLRYFSKSVESKWPESSVTEGPGAVVAIAEAIVHWGVGTTVATAHTVAQRVAIAAPVATWEDGAGEAVAHGVWVGRLGEQGMNFLCTMEMLLCSLLLYMPWLGNAVKNTRRHFHSWHQFAN